MEGVKHFNFTLLKTIGNVGSVPTAYELKYTTRMVTATEKFKCKTIIISRLLNSLITFHY